MRLTSWRTAASVLAAMAALAACRQLVGIGDAPPGAPADAAVEGAVCGITYGGNDCEACLETSCCESATACSREPACSALEACLGACAGDPSCRAQCTLDHLVGPDTSETELASCLTAQCADPCALPCGGVAAFFGPDAAGCQNCIVGSSACSTGQTCGQHPACLAGLRCAFTTHTFDRLEACDDSLDGGAEASTATFAGIASACAGACAIGQQWSCVGHMQAPAPTTQPTTMTVHLFDTPTGTPVSGATVGFCSPSDSICSSGTQTDDIPSNPVGSAVDGYLTITGADLYPELLFWGFPLSEPSVSITSTTLSQEEANAAVALGAATGHPVDLSRALMGIRILDCADYLASGVTVTIDPVDLDTTYFYEANSTYDPSLTATTSQGFVLVANVPTAGPVRITAVPTSMGRPSTVLAGVVVQGSAVTGVGLAPNQ